MKERLGFGAFKKMLMKNYGKNHEAFSHYFTIKRKNK